MSVDASPLHPNHDVESGSLDVYCLDSQRHLSVDVELYPFHKTVRIMGVDDSLSCSDFSIRVCRLLSLKPSRHTLMVLDISNTQAVWRRPPPCSGVNYWIDRVPAQYHVPVFRLLSKSHIKSTESHSPSPRLETGSYAPKKTSAFSGPEFLKQIGTRIVVHLPGGRKVAVRVHLDLPVFEAVLEVCRKRRLSPGCYFLCNPQNGIPVDPSASFCSQDLSNLELRACSVENSNLTALAESMVFVGETNFGTCQVESFACRSRTKSVNTDRSTYPEATNAPNSSNLALRSHTVGPLALTQSKMTEQRSETPNVHSLCALHKRTGARTAPWTYKKRRAPLPPGVKQTPTPSCTTTSQRTSSLDASSMDEDRVLRDRSNTSTLCRSPQCSEPRDSNSSVLRVVYCSCSPPALHDVPAKSLSMESRADSVKRIGRQSTSNLNITTVSCTEILCDQHQRAIGSDSLLAQTIEQCAVGGRSPDSEACLRPSPPHLSQGRDSSPPFTKPLKIVTRDKRSCVRRAAYVNDANHSATASTDAVLHCGPPLAPRPSLEILTQHPKYHTFVSKSADQLNCDESEHEKSNRSVFTPRSLVKSTDRSSTSTLSIDLQL